MNDANGNKPAAIYLRRSTDKQEQSLGDQRAEILRYAGENGFDVVAEYIDDSISGTSAQGRDAFLRIIDDARQSACRFRYVLAYDIKRFGRTDLDEAGYYRWLLRENGVEVHYVAEGFSGHASDDIVRAVKQYQAREESRALSLVTIRGLLSRVRAGFWPGGVPPYGYDLQYFDVAGRPLFKVRYADTGEKHVLYPDGSSTRVLERGQRVQKAKADAARLVLSTPERVRVVREMADMALSRGWDSRASRRT